MPKANEKYINVCKPKNALSAFSIRTKHTANNKKSRGNKTLTLILYLLIEKYIPIENTSNLSTVHEKIPIGENQSNPTKGFIYRPFKKKSRTIQDIENKGHLLRQWYKKGDIIYKIIIVWINH